MNKMNLLLAGDFMISEEYLNFIKSRNSEPIYPFKELNDLFDIAEIKFINLECSFSNVKASMRENTGPQLYCPPSDSISVLKSLGINAISLSNNHINDFGESDMIKTKLLLEDEGLNPFGVGKNLSEARKGIIIGKNNIKVGFLGYTTNTNKDRISPDIGASIATENIGGCVYYDIENIKKDIVRLKSKSDFICVSLHWGHELYSYPSPNQIKLAHAIIDAGADIIIGHHPHVLQGIEEYEKGIIFYSLGNFFFWNYHNIPELPNECNDFMLVNLTINKDYLENYEINLGTLTEDYQLKLYKENENEKYKKLIDKFSKKILINDYEQFWNSYKNERSRDLKLIYLKGTLKLLFMKIKKEGLKASLNKKSFSLLKNYLKSIFK